MKIITAKRQKEIDQSNIRKLAFVIFAERSKGMREPFNERETEEIADKAIAMYYADNCVLPMELNNILTLRA